MSTRALLREIVSVILRHANPDRIYLYGSQATGEAREGSDIDIAYDDPECREHGRIEAELDALPTLMKIDVKNIARTEARFRNRVRSTGKVLYSSSKRLRAEDGLYNFAAALVRLEQAIAYEQDLQKEGFGDIYLDLIVKRFEFTYEMAWKAIKHYLDYLGIGVKSPRAAFKEGYAQGLIASEELWLEMIEQRNLGAHVYDEIELGPIRDAVGRYAEAFGALRARLETELKGDTCRNGTDRDD